MYLWFVTACQHEDRTTWQQELNVFEDLNLLRDYRSANLQIDLWKAENDVNYECLAHINKSVLTTYQRNKTSRTANPAMVSSACRSNWQPKQNALEWKRENRFAKK